MSLKMKLGRFAGPLNCCEWCEFSSRSWHLFEQHLNRCQHGRSAVAKADAETKGSPLQKRRRNYRCNSCDFHAQRPKPLLQHVKEAHQPDLEIYSCELCNYASRFKHKVTQHKKVAHDKVLPVPMDGADSHSVDDVLVLKQELGKIQADDEVVFSTAAPAKKRNHSYLTSEGDTSDCLTKMKLVKCPKISKEAPQEFQAADRRATSSGISSTETKPLLSSDDEDHCRQEPSIESQSNRADNRKEVRAQAAVGPDISNLITKEVGPKTGENGGPNPKVVRYKCQLCSYLNSHKLAVVKHLRSIHGKKIGHFCTKCEFIANSKVELSRHILTHSRRKHKCPDCLFITVKKRDFLEHRACHVISGPYSCSTCSFCSTSESVILAHKADHHLQDETLDLKKNDHGKPPIAKVQSLQYACDLCSATFQNQSDVLEHMSAVHPSTCLFKCAICKRVFKNRRCLNIHIKLAHGLSASDRRRSSDKSRKTEVSVLPGTASEDSSSLLTKMKAAEISEKKSNCIKEGLKVKIKKPAKAKKKLKLSKPIHLKHSVVSDDKSLVKLSVSQNLITSNYDEKSQKELEVMPILEQQIDSDLFPMSDEQAQSGIKIAADGSKFLCVECDVTLTSKTSLECHLSRYHLGSVLYNCPFCSYKCLWKLSIKNHLKIHRNISKSVDNTNQLIDQSFCLSGVAPAVPGQKPVGSHGESVLSDSVTEASLQPSPLSPYKANSSDCEHVSKKNRHSNSRLSSVMDSAAFEIKEEVNRDVAGKLRVDEKADKFYCSTCNMNCDSASRLARHRERHADLKRFKCSLCGVRSNWDFYIRNHIQKSHAARGGKMKVLTEAEARRTIEEYNRRPKGSHVAKSTLYLKTPHKDKDGSRHDFKKAEHNKIADAAPVVGSKPIVENNPKVPIPVPSDRRKYHNWFCDQCPFATDSPSKLASHKDAHEDLKRFLCPVCGKRSNWVLYIQAHIRKAHRSSKAKAVELTHEEARQTLSDYLSQGRNYFLPGSRKSRAKPKKPKQKFSSKTTVNSETNSVKKIVPKEVLDEETDYLQDGVGFSENFEDSCSNKDSLLPVGSLNDSFASVNSGHPSDSKTRIPSNRSSSSGQIQGNEFCKYKRYKCSVCGMRTNWPAALRRHKLSMHPHAKTVKLPVGEAKATLDLYENQLKHEIFVSNILAKSDGDVKNKVSSETKTQPVTAKQFLKKRKPPSSTMLFGCSHCDYKSKWKNNVYKHAKHVHPGAKIISCKAKPVKKSKDYSCSECGLKSESVIALRKHVQSMHTSTRTSGLESSQSKAATFPRFSDSAFDSLALDSNKEPSLDASALDGEQYSQEKCSAQLVHPSEPSNSSIDSTVLNAGRIASYQKKNWMASELPHSVNTTLMSKFRRPRNFSCSGCPYRGDRRLYVLKHIRSVHAKSNCHVIHIRSRNRSKLMPEYHRRLPQSLQINREPMHQCDICPYRAARLNRLEKHRGLHTAKPGCSYECTLCPYYCPSSYCLEKHMLWHKTKTSTNSDGHLRNDHAYSQILHGVNKRSKFTCEKCPYMSGNCQHFLYHKQFHRPSPSAAYKCDVCPFWVAEKRMIVQHAKLHQCSTSQPSMQSEETGMLDDVVETARVKWDIIAAKCVPAVENKTAPLAPSGDGRTNEIDCRTARNKSSSPRSLLASKSFTEMWLNGSLVGSGNESRLEENSMDSLESSRLASKYSSTDDLARNGRLKENDLDVNKFDRRSISNASGDFDLPAARSWHCEKCPYLTTFLINFKRHMSLHGSQQRYECQFCDYSVPRYYLLLQHRKLHFAPNRNLLFSQTITSLQRVAQLEGGREELLKEITHVAATGSASEPVFYEDTLEFRFPSKLFRCDDCPYSTTQHKSFAAHQKHHTVVSAYNCPYCSYSVGKERLLNSHVIEHFNVPGCEMSAYSSAEAPELLESMKATILLLSGIRTTLEVAKEAVDCSEIKAEVEPVTEKPKPEECYDSKDILYSVDNETQRKLNSVANNDLKVAESQIKCEETSKPGQSVDNDDDDLILILETNPGSQEDLTGPGDGGSTHDDGINYTQLALEVESVEDATSEKESDDFEAKPALDIRAVNRDKHIDSSGRKASDYHCDGQNGFGNLNADLEEDKETGSKSETNSSIRVINPTAMDCVIVTSREESKGLVASSTDQMHLADDEHRSAADESSDIEDTFILLISDSEPETTPGDGNEVGKDCEEERFGS